MAQSASLHRGFSDSGMVRAFVFALILHIVIVLFFAVNFRWLSDSKFAGESVIKAKAVSLPKKAKTKPKPVKKAKPVTKVKKKKAKKKARKKTKTRDKKKQQQIEQQLREQLQKEQQQAAAAKAARLLEKYKAVIRQKVSRNWVRPASITAGKQCVVQVRLVAGGEVISAEVVKSSGDAAFDRSVESAVYKAAPLPVPDDPDVFDYFRDIEFLFRPED